MYRNKTVYKWFYKPVTIVIYNLLLDLEPYSIAT